MKRVKSVVFVWIALLTAVPEALPAESLIMAEQGTKDPIALMLMDQGARLYEGNNLEGAQLSFAMAAQVDPTLQDAYFNAAVTAADLGKTQQALVSLETLLSRYPKHPQGRRLYATLKGVGPAGVSQVTLGGGFYEFGLLALMGSLFLYTVAAYDIGVTQSVPADFFSERRRISPITNVHGESAIFRRNSPLTVYTMKKSPLPYKTAVTASQGSEVDDDQEHEWIEAA